MEEIAYEMVKAYGNYKTQGQAVEAVLGVHPNADLNILQAMWSAIDAYIVGQNGIEKILPYQEPGGMGYATWIAVFRKGMLDQRINVAFLESIVYS
jgi:hypothetical protein